MTTDIAVTAQRAKRIHALRAWFIGGVPTAADMATIDKRIAQDNGWPIEAVRAVPIVAEVVG
ncbi:hypothetical protein [Frigidibacter sp. MR17.24]|uniref:hypothetical protein n=1 Tax=Frigidibacter sp. MR17.24 TaxID=3127345 RepID=UPI0030131735